ncbi:MAG: SulP family inorganic anion transporter [Candidatus Promineifilaceae bacterium]
MQGFRVSRQTFISDLISGLIMALVNIPGALGNGLLAGVNPVYGLYSMIAGTTVAAIFTSSVIMNVDSTSATAIASGEELAGLNPADQLAALVVLGILVGLFQLIFGILKLGFLTRFISNSVMTGFLTGIGILTILGQVGDITGYYSGASNKVIRTIDTVTHAGQIHLTTLGVGLLVMAIIFIMDRTKYGRYSYLVALLAATILVAVWQPVGVAVVGDSTAVPRSFIQLHLPDLSLVPRLIIPALAIAIIALVQAAGVSQSVPNPDGEYPDPNGDFRGQGLANVATGFAGGIPVGGSLSGTTLIKQMGGQTRWANIFTGLFAMVAVLTVGPLIELIPMPALAGILVMVGISMINVGRLQIVRNTGATPMLVMAVTLVATLFLPIQYAVGVGVILHILLYVFSSSEQVRITSVQRQEDGTLVETEAPSELSSEEVYMLVPLGSLFFAGAAQLEENLPDTGDAEHSVVILGLRERDEVGSTFINVINRYAVELQKSGNRLMLAGVNERVLEQLQNTGVAAIIGEENIYPEQAAVGAAMLAAETAAEAWIEEQK